MCEWSGLGVTELVNIFVFENVHLEATVYLSMCMYACVCVYVLMCVCDFVCVHLYDKLLVHALNFSIEYYLEFSQRLFVSLHLIVSLPMCLLIIQ